MQPVLPWTLIHGSTGCIYNLSKVILLRFFRTKPAFINDQKVLSYPSKFLGKGTSEVKRFINKCTFIQNQIYQSLIQCSPGVELGLYLLLWFMVCWHIQQEQSSSPLLFSLTVKSVIKNSWCALVLMLPWIHTNAQANSQHNLDEICADSWIA